MESLEEKVLETITTYQLIEKGDKIVLGVSGGPDSMCMLQILINLCQIAKRDEPFWQFSQRNQTTREKQQKKIDQTKKNYQKNSSFLAEIVVAHVNHKIREEADEEEQYVRNYCEENGIEFYTKRIDIQKMAHTNKTGIEETGRIARYQFFDEVLKKTKANKIAVAHHKNDKVETILLHMLRGSGIEGLKGIETKRGNIIRPLIECERTQIEQYCEKYQLKPKIDKSNFDNTYDRNRIRNIVIPYIQQQFNPNIVKTIDRLSTIAQLEDEYIESHVKKAYQDLLEEEKAKEIIINLKKFNLQEKVIKSRLIRYIIKRLFGTTASIEKIHIEDIIKLCDNNIGNKYLTPNKNVKVLVKNHKIYFINLII